MDSNDSEQQSGVKLNNFHGFMPGGFCRQPMFVEGYRSDPDSELVKNTLQVMGCIDDYVKTNYFDSERYIKLSGDESRLKKEFIALKIAGKDKEAEQVGSMVKRCMCELDELALPVFYYVKEHCGFSEYELAHGLG